MECFSLSHIYDVISTCNKSYLLFNLESMICVCYPSSTVRTFVEPWDRYRLMYELLSNRTVRKFRFLAPSKSLPINFNGLTSERKIQWKQFRYCIQTRAFLLFVFLADIFKRMWGWKIWCGKCHINKKWEMKRKWSDEVFDINYYQNSV